MMASSPSNTPTRPNAPTAAGAWEAWKQFWFTKADPTLLGLLRICVGVLAIYVVVGYTFDLEGFFGKDSLVSLSARRLVVDQTPVVVPPLNLLEPEEMQNVAVPQTTEQTKYVEFYKKRWNQPPPVPFPMSKTEPGKIDWKRAKEINDYRAFWGADPRLLHTQGTPEWSIWFHVTDPQMMTVLHMSFIAVTVLFAFGFCTRLTSVLTWFALMSYVHRSPATLFGVDTMMNIIMIYLIIGPSGAALSLDAWIKRWWASGSEGAEWLKRLLGYPESDAKRLAQSLADGGAPKPTVVANFALRALQIHVCFIYAAAGLSKLKGDAWWDGTAVWHTLANFEFAPMASTIYVWFLGMLTRQNILLNLFIASGTYFTLFFEISYPFLIWGRRTRWFMLAMAVILHGFIGAFMGLKTFALMMIVMNMAFLPSKVTRTLVDFGARYGLLILVLVLWPFGVAFLPKEVTSRLEDMGYVYWMPILCLLFVLLGQRMVRGDSGVSKRDTQMDESETASLEKETGDDGPILSGTSPSKTGVLIKKKAKRKGKSTKKELA